MERSLLREDPIFEDIEIVELTETEDDSGLRILKIKGTASRGNVFNRNNRMYPTKVLKNVAEKVEKSIKKGKLTGQLDHPSFTSNGDLERTAIKFTKMWMEDDYLRFEGNVLPTTPGKELAVLLKSKVGVGMSTRGYGTLLPFKKSNGKEDHSKLVVQDDFELFGVDAVLNESNQFAKVAHFENKKGGNNVDELTLELLKKDHPELVEAFKQEVTADIEKDFEQKVSDAVAEKVNAEKEAYKQEVMDSEEVKGMKEFINGIVEAVKPFVPGQKEYEETEKQKEIDALTAKVADITSEKDNISTELKGLKAEKAAEEAKKVIAAHTEEKVKGHKFAEQLKVRLSECASVEDVDAKFDQEVAFIESLVKETVPAGEGKVPDNEEDDSTKVKTKLDDHKVRERKLAGLEEKKEGGK